jgi:hypothetical protein
MWCDALTGLCAGACVHVASQPPYTERESEREKARERRERGERGERKKRRRSRRAYPGRREELGSNARYRSSPPPLCAMAPSNRSPQPAEKSKIRFPLSMRITVSALRCCV